MLYWVKRMNVLNGQAYFLKNEVRDTFTEKNVHRKSSQEKASTFLSDHLEVHSVNMHDYSLNASSISKSIRLIWMHIHRMVLELTNVVLLERDE